MSCRRRSCRLSSAVGVPRYVGFSSGVVVVRGQPLQSNLRNDRAGRLLQECSSVNWTSPVSGLLRSSTRIPELSGSRQKYAAPDFEH